MNCSRPLQLPTARERLLSQPNEAQNARQATCQNKALPESKRKAKNRRRGKKPNKLKTVATEAHAGREKNKIGHHSVEALKENRRPCGWPPLDLPGLDVKARAQRWYSGARLSASLGNQPQRVVLTSWPQRGEGWR